MAAHAPLRLCGLAQLSVHVCQGHHGIDVARVVRPQLLHDRLVHLRTAKEAPAGSAGGGLREGFVAGGGAMEATGQPPGARSYSTTGAPHSSSGAAWQQGAAP